MKCKSNYMDIVKEIGETYFEGQTKFTSDELQKIYNVVELFNNGMIKVDTLISDIAKHTKDIRANILKIVVKYVDFEGYYVIYPFVIAKQIIKDTRVFETEIYKETSDFYCKFAAHSIQPSKNQRSITINGFTYDLKFE